MILYFKQKLDELRLSDHEFFETAYMAIFGKLHDCTSDTCQFRLHGIIPRYAIAYLQYLQRSEPCTVQDVHAQSKETHSL